MSNSKLRLVYNVDALHTDSAKINDHASSPFSGEEQLSLFEPEKSYVYFISLEHFNGKALTNFIVEESINVIVDTRMYPEFFSCYRSTKEAFRVFDEQNIEYVHIPFDWNAEHANRWMIKETLEQSMHSFVELTAEKPMSILILTQMETNKQKTLDTFSSIDELDSVFEKVL